MWLVLFMIKTMALWHRAWRSSSLGGYRRFKTSLAYVRVYMVCAEMVVVGVSVFGLGSMLLAVFLSRMMRLSCLASDFVTGGCSFVFVSLGGSSVIGHIVWARRW